MVQRGCACRYDCSGFPVDSVCDCSGFPSSINIGADRYRPSYLVAPGINRVCEIKTRPSRPRPSDVTHGRHSVNRTRSQFTVPPSRRIAAVPTPLYNAFVQVKWLQSGQLVNTANDYVRPQCTVEYTSVASVSQKTVV